MGRPRKTGDRGKYGLFTFVLYPESQAEQIAYAQENWSCAWALHDKDTYDEASFQEYKEKHGGQEPPWHIGDVKKPHLHFVFKPVNKRSIHGVAHELGVPDHVIEKGDNLRALYEYLWHKDDATKYRYEKSIVHCHDFDEPDENNPGFLSDEEQAKLIRAMPDEIVTLDGMMEWALANGCWSCFSGKYVMWRDWRKDREYKQAGKAYADFRQEQLADKPTNWVDLPGARALNLGRGEFPERGK